MMIHHQACGCLVIRDPDWQVLRAVEKCEFHRAWLRSQPCGQAYYEQLHCFDADGTPRCTSYVEQLQEAVGAFPLAAAGARAIEIGCGVSMYAGAILAAGYTYQAWEPDVWAATWTRQHYKVPVTTLPFETAPPGDVGRFQLVLCAHAVEHMPHAPRALRELGNLLRPGGVLYIVVPDDTDLCNPDHHWFFSAETLQRTIERVGLKVDRLETRKYIDRENFLYCLAHKPEPSHGH